MMDQEFQIILLAIQS